MKKSAINTTCAMYVLIVAASSVCATVYQDRDEINKSFTLAAKSQVEVSAISGSVDIKAIDGDTATVQIRRTGRSRGELDCNKVVLEQAADGLVVQSKTVGGPGCQNIQVVYRVLLSLPRYLDLSVSGVSGPVNIGEMEGALRISGNSGNINLAQSGRGSNISGNSGTITINLRRLDTGALDVMGNSGAIKLYIADGLDVDVKVLRISGSVSSDLPNVQFNKTGDADYYARIGSGGTTIKVDGNSGNVSLSRYQE